MAEARSEKIVFALVLGTLIFLMAKLIGLESMGNIRGFAAGLVWCLAVPLVLTLQFISPVMAFLRKIFTPVPETEVRERN